MKLNKYTNRPYKGYTATGKLWKKASSRQKLTEKEAQYIKNMNRKIRRAWKATGEETKAPTIGLRQAREYRMTHSKAELKEAIRRNLNASKGMADPEFVDNMVAIWRNQVWENVNEESADLRGISNVIIKHRNSLTHKQMTQIKEKFYDWKNGNLDYRELVENIDDIIYGTPKEGDVKGERNKEKRIERLMEYADWTD